MAGSAFGAQNPTPAFGGMSFGASTSTTTTPSFSTSTFGATSTNVSASNTGFSFGNPSTATPSLFGTTTAAAPFGSTATTTSAFPTLGQPAVTSAPSGFSFGFGTTNPSTSTFAGGGLATGVPVVTSAPATMGLGGVDLQSSSLTGTDTSGKTDKAIKEMLVPNEIIVTFDAFKKFLKEQKAIREEMSRVSGKNILKVQSQVSALRQQLAVVSNGLQRNVVAVAKLKEDSSQEINNAEIIQRTKDTPPASQYENTAPAVYFHNIAISFENQMQSYRQQIEQLERHLISLSQPSTMTPNELTVVMRNLHDAFVTLAAQLQTVHQQVQLHKDQFLAIQKVNNADILSIFQSRKELGKDVVPIPVNNLSATFGPTPVSQGFGISPPVTASIIRNPTQATQGLTGAGLSSSQQGFGGGSTFNFQPSSTFKPLGK